MDKVNVIMSVYNSDVVLKEALESIYNSPMCDGLIIFEGAFSPRAESQRSTDKSIPIIKEFIKGKSNILYHEYEKINPNKYPYKCDKHRDFVLKHHNNGHPYFDGKSLAQLMLCRDTMLSIANADWVFEVDADEVYALEDLKRLREFIDSSPKEDLITIEHLVFYFDFWHYRKERFRRIFRKLPDCFFSDDNSIDTPKGSYDTNKLDLDPAIATCFHYGYIGAERVKKKLEIWNKEDVDFWEKNVWEEKNLMKAYMKNAGGVHLFAHKNPGYSGYRLLDFKGEHPEIMKSNPYFNYRHFTK